MKNWLPMALILVVLPVSIFLVWFDEGPSIVPSTHNIGEERSQLEPRDSKQPFDPDKRASAWQNAASDPDSTAVQANDLSPAEASKSRPHKPAKINNDASSFPSDEESKEPEEHYIGGYVQDEDGNPLSRIEVEVERIDDSDGATPLVDQAVETAKSIFTDSEGGFLVSELKDGEYRVRLAPVEGIAPAQTKVRAGTLNVKLVVVRLRDIRVFGTVKSTDGTPIKDVHIVADSTTHNTKSGSRGEYELDISWQGNQAIQNILFQHEDFRPQRIRFNPADLDDLTRDFQLDVSMEPLKRLTTVSGNIKDPRGNPTGGMTLTILTSQMRTMYTTQSYENGDFLFEEVEPGGDYCLAIRPGSPYKNKDINPLVIPDQGLHLDIVLELAEQGELAGWMIDPDGNPISGFSLTLHSTIASGQSVNVTGDQQGFFFVEGFPVGGALFSTKSYPLLMVQGIRVFPDPRGPITVVLDMGRNVLQGSVKTSFGEPVAAASVSLDWSFRYRNLTSSSSRKTTTGQNGDFVFTDLGSDLHTLRVSAAGFRNAVLTIDVGTGPKETVVELEEEDK